MILLAATIAVCAALLVIGFLAPRWSAKPQSKLNQGLDAADEKAGDNRSLPRRMAHRSTDTSRKAVNTATETGRSARREVD